MKKVLLLNLIAFFLLPLGAFAQKKVYMSDDVQKTAAQIRFDYKGMVKKAAAKDESAVKQLFEFSRILDGAETIDHAVTCLELIPQATDEVVANAIAPLNPKLKKVLLQRMIQAQQQTTKADLKKPLEKWAPMTWDAINDRPIKKAGRGSSELQQGKSRSGTAQDTAPDAGGNKAPDSESGRQ